MSRSVIVTLVPAIDQRLSDARIRPVLQALGGAGARLIDSMLIDEGSAADLLVDLDDETTTASLRDAVSALGLPLDVFVQTRAMRRKQLLICDMDSTMIGQECIDELADFAGVKAQVAEITERAMLGELEFEAALTARVALLRGLPVSVVDRVLAERITINPGGRELVRTMRAEGAVTALVSGGFTLFTEPLAGTIGFAIHRANVLEAINDVLTGEVRKPILGQEAKRRTLIELAASGIPLERTMAVGDGANDLGMIEAAGLGVAYRAKPAVAAIADARLEHADLTALLYAQGYRRADFIT